MNIASLSAALIRFRASRLPTALALRMEEEWLGELNSISSRPGRFAFAVALLLTRRRAFVAPGEDTVMREVPTLGSRKSLVILSTAILAIAAYGASFLVPVKYESGALLQNRERDDRVLVQARSNSLLAAVVDELKLEPREYMIEDLRKNITVDPLHGDPASSGSLFWVKYRASDPESAQRVASKLTTTLIEQDMGYRFVRLSEEEKFLGQQLAILADRLQDKGAELAFQRTRNASNAAASGMLALDHELLVSSYKAMFAKHQDVEMAASLHASRLTIVDPPQPGSALVPNRAAYAGIGALAGFALGGMAVFSLSRRERRLLTKVV